MERVILRHCVASCRMDADISPTLFAKLPGSVSQPSLQSMNHVVHATHRKLYTQLPGTHVRASRQPSPTVGLPVFELRGSRCVFTVRVRRTTYKGTGLGWATWYTVPHCLPRVQAQVSWLLFIKVHNRRCGHWHRRCLASCGSERDPACAVPYSSDPVLARAEHVAHQVHDRRCVHWHRRCLASRGTPESGAH